MPTRTQELPTLGHEMLSSIYEMPAQIIETPTKTHESPSLVIEMHLRTYEMTTRGYGIPVLTHEIPSRIYEIPLKTHEILGQVCEMISGDFEMVLWGNETFWRIMSCIKLRMI